jgi:hypothetical protein
MMCVWQSMSPGKSVAAQLYPLGTVGDGQAVTSGGDLVAAHQHHDVALDLAALDVEHARRVDGHYVIRRLRMHSGSDDKSEH